MDLKVKTTTFRLITKIRYRIYIAGRRRNFAIRRDFEVEKKLRVLMP